VSTKTKHLAIQYFDNVLLNIKIEKSSAWLIAYLCLFIAAKFEGEVNEGMIHYKINLRRSVLLSESQLLKVEGQLLNSIGWNVSQVTAPEILKVLLAVLNIDLNTANEQIQEAERILDICIISKILLFNL
jgi:hypothetical protein